MDTSKITIGIDKNYLIFNIILSSIITLGTIIGMIYTFRFFLVVDSSILSMFGSLASLCILSYLGWYNFLLLIICYNYDKRTTLVIDTDTGKVTYNNANKTYNREFYIADIKECSRHVINKLTSGFTIIMLQSGEEIYVTNLILLDNIYSLYPEIKYTTESDILLLKVFKLKSM